MCIGDSSLSLKIKDKQRKDIIVKKVITQNGKTARAKKALIILLNFTILLIIADFR